jgi:signal transduction histidine kinase
MIGINSKRYLPSFLLALAALTLIAVAFLYVGVQPYNGFFYDFFSYRVYDIAPDGPAEQAGLQVGDRLAEVRGVPVEQAASIYGQGKAGDTVTFSILRGDQSLSLPLVLTTPPLSVTLTRLEPLLIALSFWFIAVAVLVLKPAAREAQLFFLFCLAGSGVLVAGELSRFRLDIATRLFNILLAWLSPLVFHFHALFPQRKAFFLRRSNLKLLYSLGLGLSLPYALWLYAHPWEAFWYSSLYRGLRIVFALSALASVGLLLHAYRTTGDIRIRRRVRLIVLGTAWASAPLVLLSLLPEALTGSRLVAYEVSFLTLPLIPLSYAVAIYKYNLLDIDRFLNRSLVHFILVVFWVGSYLLLVAALNVWLPDAMFARPLLGALVTLVMAMTLVSLRQRTQRWVDRVFYGGWYDYRSVVAGVSAVLSEAQDEAALVEQLINQVATTMGLKGAALFLTDEEDVLTLRGCTGFGCLSKQAPLSLDSPLAQLLRQEGKPLEHSDVQRQLVGASISDTEQAWLATKQVQLWIPLVFKGELKGLLLMGSKEGDDFFSIEDLRILKTLAHQAALAAENILLLESLRRQVKELTFLSSELEATHRRLLTSREDERKRLARDLHDQLLQDLFALNIGLQTTVGMVGDDSIVERLVTMRQDVTCLADEVRRLCVELRPPSLSILGLADAIRSYTNEWAERRENIRVVGSFASWDVANPKLTITLELAQDRKRLDDQVAIALFRVYQEALVNVEKHATAENVWVREQLEKERVELNIRDDGCGFDVPKHLGQFVRQGHFGLLGGQERMAAVGGGIQVTSEPGAGTELHAWAPVNGNEDNV